MEKFIELPVLNKPILICRFCGSTTFVCLTKYESKTCENR